jgi:hypothetical protein
MFCARRTSSPGACLATCTTFTKEKNSALGIYRRKPDCEQWNKRLAVSTFVGGDKRLVRFAANSNVRNKFVCVVGKHHVAMNGYRRDPSNRRLQALMDVGSHFAEYISELGAKPAATESSEAESATGPDEGARVVERKGRNISEKSGSLAILTQILFDIR